MNAVSESHLRRWSGRHGVCHRASLLVAQREPGATTERSTVFEGARLITGDGSAPIEDSIFTVTDGAFSWSAVDPRCRSQRERRALT